MIKIPCFLEFDERTSVVTLRHAKTGTIQMVIKLESGSEGTMTRIVPEADCDNFWMAVKPTDSVVFDDVLFGKKKLVIDSLKFHLEKK